MTRSAPSVVGIIGGGIAAAEAAKTLRSEGFDGAITIVAEEPLLPYERPPLTKGYLRGEEGPEKLLPKDGAFYADAGIDVRTGVAVASLDPGTRSVTLDDGSALRFDRLLLATGARAALPAIEGIDLPWVHTIRTASDADRLRGEALRASTAVVVGGGWIAAEAAASLRTMGLDVTLVIPRPRLLERHLGLEVGQELTSLHERHGVRIVTGGRVAALRDRAGRHEVVLADGTSHAADLALLGLGASPASELASRAGLDVRDGILVDEQLATSAPGIFAAGDVASAWHPTYAERIRPEHWDNARRQGRTAARNMLGAGEVYDRVPFFYSDQYDLGLEVIGRPAIGTERMIRREDDGFVALWTRDGRVVAGMHANLWDRKKALDRLVTTRAAVDPVEFADPGVPFGAPLESAA